MTPVLAVRALSVIRPRVISPSLDDTHVKLTPGFYSPSKCERAYNSALGGYNTVIPALNILASRLTSAVQRSLEDSVEILP
jgi:hypothetical protein